MSVVAPPIRLLSNINKYGLQLQETEFKEVTMLLSTLLQLIANNKASLLRLCGQKGDCSHQTHLTQEKGTLGIYSRLRHTANTNAGRESFLTFPLTTCKHANKTTAEQYKANHEMKNMHNLFTETSQTRLQLRQILKTHRGGKRAPQENKP